MNKMIELRQKRAALLDEVQAMNAAAEKEDRDFNPTEQASYDSKMKEALDLANRIERLEASERAFNQAGLNTGKAPVFNKTQPGDNETRALAAFFRSGDKGGVSHLVKTDERGVNGVTLDIPTQYQTRNLEQRAVVDSTMNITTAADGGNIVPTGFTGVVAMRKNEMMLAERLGVRRVPGQGTTVNYPVEAADPEDFAATSETADNHSTVYERDAGNTGVKAFTLAKKTRKIDLTEELLEDNDVDLLGYIADRIARQIAQTHNGMLLTEVAANGTTLKTYASATAIAAGEPEEMVFHSTVGYYLDESRSVGWVMRPPTFGAIASLTGSSRLYAETPGGSFAKELLGYPVYYSNKAAATAASAKDVYFGNWDQVGYREAPQLRFIQDPYSVDGLVILKYSFRAVYGVLQAGAIGYGVHPSA